MCGAWPSASFFRKPGPTVNSLSPDCPPQGAHSKLGKKHGISRISACLPLSACVENLALSASYAQIPYESEQGINFGKQAVLFAEQRIRDA
jgi:hypothetical protein